MTNQIKTAVMIQNMDNESRLIKYETKYIMSSEDSKTILSFLPSTKYTPVKGDRIWFYPGCDIPRFKVKQFCIANDVVVVKYKEKSSVRFIGPETLKDMMNNYHCPVANKDEFIVWLDTVMCNAYMGLREAIVKSEANLVYILYPAMQSFVDEDVFGTKLLYPDINSGKSASCYYIKDNNNYQQIIDMINYPGLRPQDDLLSLLNTGTEMDEKMYEDIHRLFESTDKENTRLAMEAMANCDFQKSAVYLLLLLKEYGQKISDSGNKHHVNFKSLIKYFQIKDLENVSVDDMIDSLRHQKLLNVDNLNRLMPLAMETIRKEGDMNNIKIKDVELSPEAELAVAENILDQQSPPPVDDEPEQDSHSTMFAQTTEPDLGTL